MKRGWLYTPAWRSPNDPDRKVAVKTPRRELTGNEGGTLLPRRDVGKVVPVSVHIEDNGLCTDDDDDGGDQLLPTTSSEERQRTDDVGSPSTTNCAGPSHHQSVPPPSASVSTSSSSSSSSSMSGELRAYNDSNLNTSVYDLPSELDAAAQSTSALPRPRTGSTVELRQSRVEVLASTAVSAVVRSCQAAEKRHADTDPVNDRGSSSVSSPSVFVVSEAKQLVIFTVDRTPHQCRATAAAVSPVQLAAGPPLSLSDQTLNR